MPNQSKKSSLKRINPDSFDVAKHLECDGNKARFEKNLVESASRKKGGSA
ncbi:hypothetical protein Rleg2_0743 [Rhizobium leguminosarum bv. trifolii WSM2304]|uniref:YfhD family protein n=1 Tax=Rhizobium leguminosarum bv. trifolii (strain WSM2304) TaxID=395492 RepID=A0ABF7QJG5_RHILW|nr:hypothetical protein Rleg2_0743 [Rhizobium leguminosarum bv. trifolii WSM2304]